MQQVNINVDKLEYYKSMERVAQAAMAFLDYTGSVTKLQRYLEAKRRIRYLEKEPDERFVEPDECPPTMARN